MVLSDLHVNGSLPTPSEVAPVLAGRNTRVRPVIAEDYEWLFKVAVLTPAGSRWRMHGEIPNYEQFLGTLFGAAKATCIIEDLAGDRLGMVQLWATDLLSGHSQLTAFLSPEAEGKGWPLEGVFAFLDYAFRAFNLRKIYVESLETEAQSYRSLVGSLLHEEGHKRKHQYVFGQYVDCFVYAIYRDEFLEFAPRVLPSARRRVGDDAIPAG